MFSRDTERALLVALDAHCGQVRKGLDGGPYAVHPIHAALMLARWNQPPRVLQAAILHDVVEDSEDWTVERVREEFGEDVAEIVDELTEDKSKSWQERKDAAVEHVAHMSPAACVVKAADKMHNLESLAWDLERAESPEAVWSKFKGGRERTLEYTGRLVAALAERLPHEIARGLEQALGRVSALP